MACCATDGRDNPRCGPRTIYARFPNLARNPRKRGAGKRYAATDDGTFGLDGAGAGAASARAGTAQTNGREETAQ